MSDTPVYVVAMLDIEDMSAFMQDYAGPLQAINARHGVETLVAAPSIKTIEGTYAKSATAILKFPSQAAQEAWYNDPEYQPLLVRRKELTNTDTSVLLVAPSAGTALAE